MRNKKNLGLIIISVCAVLLLIGIICAVKKGSDTKENVVTRYEWIEMLGEQFGICKYSNTEPYFKDVDEALLAYQLYSNVATQLQLVRAKVQEAKPAFAVVEPAIVPLKAAGLGRSLTVIVMVLVTEIVAILWLLWGKGLWQQLRVFLKQNIEEEETEKR